MCIYYIRSFENCLNQIYLSYIPAAKGKLFCETYHGQLCIIIHVFKIIRVHHVEKAKVGKFQVNNINR